MATALPAALGLKLSHFAGSSTARTGGSKIGTARKIHLAEASVQQSGRGAARRRGRMERGRGFGEGTLPSPPLHRLSHPWGPPPASPCVTTATSAHPSRGTQDPSGPSGPTGWPGLLPQRAPRTSTFVLLPIPSSQRTSLARASWHGGYLSTWGGWRRLSLPEGFPVPGVASQVFLPGFLLCPDGEPPARAVWCSGCEQAQSAAP